MNMSGLQRAVFARLNGYTPLTDLVVGVFDHVEQDADPVRSEDQFPYVTVGDDTATEYDTDDAEPGAEYTITLHAWSRYRGLDEVKRIQDEIFNALRRHELAIGGVKVIDISLDFAQSFLDPDGLTRHGVSKFRILATQDTP